MPVPALVAALGQLATPLEPELASAVRDRVAGLVQADAAAAEGIAQALLDAVRANRSPVRSQAIAFRARAEALLFQGKLAAAARAYRRACDLASGLEDRPLLGQILVGRIGVLSWMGRVDEADSLAQLAVAYLTESGDLEYLGKLYMNLGNTAYHKEEYQKAAADYEQASVLFAKRGNKGPVWVGLRINQAVACGEIGRTDESRTLFLEAQAECSAQGLGHLEAQARFNHGFLEARVGDYRRALHLLESAELAFAAEGAPDLIAATSLSRAEIYLELGMPGEALELAASAALAFGAEEMELDEALAHLAEGRARFLLGQHRAATDRFTELERFYTKRGIRPRAAIVQLELARVHRAEGMHAKAVTAARAAVDALSRTGSAAASLGRRGLAEALLESGDPAGAEHALRSSLQDADKVPVAERMSLLHLAGRVAIARRQRAHARRRFDRAIEALEAQRLLIPGGELRVRAFEQDVAVYRDRIALELDDAKPDFDTLFRLVESARARGFRERDLAQARALDPETAGLRSRLGALVHRTERLDLDPGRSSSQQRAELRREIVALEREITERLRRRGWTEDGGADWTGPANPRAVAATLLPDEIVVEFFVVDDRVLVLLLGKERRSIVVLPEPVRRIVELVESFRMQVETLAVTSGATHPNLPFLQRAAESILGRLQSAILDPLKLDDMRSLILVPHGILHSVPFECLGARGSLAWERWAIRRVPTADFMLRSSSAGLDGSLEPRRRSPGKFVLAGIVEGAPPFVARELESVRAVAPEPIEFLPNASSEELLLAMAGAERIHLSTHGVFRADNPAFSRLATRGGALFVADILDRRIEADLVVLSACTSGQVFSGAGDDLSGVAHGFLSAGARRLVASLWRVHDEATRDLMVGFYREIVAGQSPDEALRRAALGMRDRWPHPFYWGAFCLQG